jgi:DNA-binding transcriptional MerR regulator
MDDVTTHEQLTLDGPAEPAAGQVGFSGRKTAEIVGISYRQLDYWARTDLVRPSLAEARGSGSRRLYSYRDLLELKVIKTLLDAGLKLESVRKVFTYMREQLGEDISSANLVISGNSSVLVRSGEELIDVLQQGQGVLNVLALAGVKDEIDARIVELRPASTSDAAAVSRVDAEIDTEVGAPAI